MSLTTGCLAIGLFRLRRLFLHFIACPVSVRHSDSLEVVTVTLNMRAWYGIRFGRERSVVDVGGCDMKVRGSQPRFDLASRIPKTVQGGMTSLSVMKTSSPIYPILVRICSLDHSSFKYHVTRRYFGGVIRSTHPCGNPPFPISCPST
jgi:hypothetical protein